MRAKFQAFSVTAPTESTLPDSAPDDGTTTTVLTYGGCTADVIHYRVNGGGHTWPGGFHYLPQVTIGKTSRDFCASEAMWSFFAARPMP